MVLFCLNRHSLSTSTWTRAYLNPFWARSPWPLYGPWSTWRNSWKSSTGMSSRRIFCLTAGATSNSAISASLVNWLTPLRRLETPDVDLTWPPSASTRKEPKDTISGNETFQGCPQTLDLAEPWQAWATFVQRATCTLPKYLCVCVTREHFLSSLNGYTSQIKSF